MYSLRLAEPADLPAIVDIYNSTVASRQVTADLEPVSVESRFDWFRAHQRRERPIWVVEPLTASRDGVSTTRPEASILGWMTLSDFHERAAYRHTAEISIYCHATMRGRGLGSYLLRQAIDFAPRVDVHTLIALVFGHNTASIALFKKFGFTTWGDLERVTELDGIERDVLILGRRLVP